MLISLLSFLLLSFVKEGDWNMQTKGETSKQEKKKQSKETQKN
jgi:hypothetical protein